MEDLKKLIAENIAKYRKMAGLTQGELAEKLNYSDKAVSKWERGDSLPDVIVLKQMAHIFGISLDSLTSEEVYKINPLKKIFSRVFTKNFLISSCGSLIVWLIATIIFVFMSIFSPNPKLWLIFIYSIPVNFIVLIALCGLWKSSWYNFLTSSLLSLGIALALFLTFEAYNLWLLFLICAPLIALFYLLFVARIKINFFRKK